MLELDCQVINFLLAIVELGQALVYRGIELKHLDRDYEWSIGTVYRLSVLFLFFFVGFVVGLPLWLAVFVMGRFNCTKACAEGMSKRPCCGVTSPCKLFPIPFTTTSCFREWLGDVDIGSKGFIGNCFRSIVHDPLTAFGAPKTWRNDGWNQLDVLTIVLTFVYLARCLDHDNPPSEDLVMLTIVCHWSNILGLLRSTTHDFATFITMLTSMIPVLTPGTLPRTLPLLLTPLSSSAVHPTPHLRFLDNILYWRNLRTPPLSSATSP